jgi:S-formylglutathione hydrolase FrmB
MNGRENVYVPGMKYQTMWLLHGGSGDDSDYVNFSNIVRYADDHKLAVVMPADYNASYHDDPNGAKYYTFILSKVCHFANLSYTTNRQARNSQPCNAL